MKVETIKTSSPVAYHPERSLESVYQRDSMFSSVGIPSGSGEFRITFQLLHSGYGYYIELQTTAREIKFIHREKPQTRNFSSTGISERNYWRKESKASERAEKNK